MLFWWSRRRAQQRALGLYAALITQARRPVFFQELKIPDTLDGRFGLVVLHAFMLLKTFKDLFGTTPMDRAFERSVRETGQELYNVMFRDFDENLREMGVGDLGVGRRIKEMVQVFHGRLQRYDAAFGATGHAEDRTSALQESLFVAASPSAEVLLRLDAYVRASLNQLRALPASTWSEVERAQSFAWPAEVI